MVGIFSSGLFYQIIPYFIIGLFFFLLYQLIVYAKRNYAKRPWLSVIISVVIIPGIFVVGFWKQPHTAISFFAGLGVSIFYSILIVCLAVIIENVKEGLGIYVFYIMFGLIVLIGGLVGYWGFRTLNHYGRTTKAVIIEGGLEGNNTWVQFQDPVKGLLTEKIIVSSPSDRVSLEEGQSINIIYNVKNPQIAIYGDRVDKIEMLECVLHIMAGLGLIIFGIYGFGKRIWVQTRKKKKVEFYF